MRAALANSVALAGACLASYALTKGGLTSVHSVSAADDLLGGVWAVIATIFVYRVSYAESVAAALSRIAATALSFALCLVYLLLFEFHAVGLAVVIGLGSFVMMVAGRPQDVGLTGITSAVVLGVAALSPHDAWQQPILRLFDTAIGVAVGVAVVYIERRLATMARASPTPDPA